MSFEKIIKKFNLLSHPEGGFYKEIYRSSETINMPALPERYENSRNFGTIIYFLLKKDDVSKFHKLKSDESWHFHSGSAIRIHIIDPEGEYIFLDLGLKIDQNEIPVIIIKKNSWFAAEVINKESYGFVSCSVFPGFDFEDFEMGNFLELSAQFPKQTDLIKRLT